MTLNGVYFYMKAHFIQLFEYETWANERIINTLEAMPFPDERSLELFSHVLAARFIWLQRIVNQKGYIPLWEKKDLLDCIELFRQTTRSWEEYLAGATENELNRVVAYTSTQGEPFLSKVSEIIVHLVNHSSYHRGQIVASLKGKVNPLPATDFIIFSRKNQ